MKKKLFTAVAVILCMGIFICGCKTENKWKKKKKAKKQTTEENSSQSTYVSKKIELKVADVKSAFEGSGWQSDARAAGKEIAGEVMYKLAGDTYSFRAAVQAQPDSAQTLQRVTIYITGPHIELQTVDQFAPKLMEILNKMSPVLKKGFSSALGDMRSLTGRGIPRRVGSGYLSSEGWKCVLVNYISEQKNGQPYMIIVEKI